MGPPHSLLLPGPLHLVGSSLHGFRASANLRQPVRRVAGPAVHWVPFLGLAVAAWLAGEGLGIGEGISERRRRPPLPELPDASDGGVDAGGDV